MFRKLINKLKAKKKQLQNYRIDNLVVETEPIKESNFDITISRENNIHKIEIDDYISISDYIQKMNSSDEYFILNFLYNCVLWNNDKQKVNKGIYYVITIDNHIYNILFTDEIIRIAERTKVELDEQTQKDNIIQERVITINKIKNEYYYYSAKHDNIGDTYYTRYYDKNRLFSLGTLNLTEGETYDEVNFVISNLETINGITDILDIELLKEYILNDLGKNLLQRKKYKE